MKQLNLFEDIQSKFIHHQQNELLMSRDTLINWKSRIFKEQQQLRNSQSPQQQSLFNLPPLHCDVDTIDPFLLKLHSSQFYRHQEKGDKICIYFVIDNTLPLLLYVGETKQTPKKRWQEHDCQSYIMQYLQLHRRYQLNVEIATAFWWDTPTDRKARQHLERELILKWRSPFNKENWSHFGQPFR
jgi:hypothetical protein